MNAALSGVCPICATTVPGTQAEPTPRERKGIFRRRGTTLLDRCIYLMENMYIESLNGVLCQVEDPRLCGRCGDMWGDLRKLIDRYDSGER